MNKLIEQSVFEQISENFANVNSIADGCKKLGDILGLDQPVTPKVFIAAVKNEEYAHNLLVSRKTKPFLNHLLASPPEVQGFQSEAEHSTKELLSSACKAIIKWAKTGFTKTSEEEIQRRFNACSKCDHIITEKSHSHIHNLLNTKARCGLCGCDIDKKIRLNNETCPGKDTKNPGYNFWGQKIN